MRLTVRFLIGLLLILGAGYYWNGVHTILTPVRHSDLRLRWQERNDLVKGINPYDLSANSAGAERSQVERQRLERFGLQDAAPTAVSGYPPWGLAAALLLIPPGPFEVTRWFYVLLSTLALATAMRFGFCNGRRISPEAGYFLMAAVAAMASNASTLRVGQYSLILNAAMILAYLADARRKPVLAGAMLFFVALKPSYSLLQFVVVTLRGKWAALCATAVFCLIGCGVTLALTGVSPAEMVRQMLHQLGGVVWGDTSLAFVVRSDRAHGIALLVLGPLALAVTAWAGWHYRRQSVLVPASVAAVLGRISTYHRQYDNAMLLFPLVALGVIAFTRPNRVTIPSFAVLAVSLWAPLPLSAYTPLTVALLATIWCGACFVICWHADVFDTAETGDRLRSSLPHA